MKKNIANQTWKVYAINVATGLPETGDASNITAKIKIDGSATASLTDTNPTELESGYYDFSLTQAETNGDELCLIAVSSTSNVVVIPLPPTERPTTILADITTIDGIVDTIDTNLDTVDGKIDTIDGIVDTIDTNLDTVDTNLDTVDGKIDTIDTNVDAIKVVTDTIGGIDTITWNYTLTDSVTGAPISGVTVWVTSDEAGSTVLASGVTNSNGVVTFYLDAGTVYVWCQKTGYSFDNPDTEVVS